MSELGDALRSWRAKTDPADAGLSRGGPRRVPGLRREELAVLAGISVEYVVRLEQGRAPTPSAQVCAALARALRLTDAETAHLMRLAGHAADPRRIPRLIPRSVYAIMDQLAANPVGIFDATWHLLHWNPLWAAALGDPSGRPASSRNALLWQFENRNPAVRQTPEELAAFEESLVSDLRGTTSRYPNDPEVAALVSRLKASARFVELWARGDVGGHESARKVIEHPEVGDIALDTDVLTTQGTNLRLVVYTPRPGTDARGKLDLLAAIGTQTMSARP